MGTVPSVDASRRYGSEGALADNCNPRETARPMSVLLFLFVPLVVIILASFVLVLRQRKPQGMRSSIEGFQQQMRALSPEDDVERKG
jgi:hypothetical protein